MTTLKWLSEHTEAVRIDEDEECCVNCKHFIQHYTFTPRGKQPFSPVHCGHCVYPRIKDRRPHDTCKHFEPKKGDSHGEAVHPQNGPGQHR